jgi:soluble lytic murein transglycosylase-like protein
MTTRRSFDRRAICIGLCALGITASHACDVRQWDREIQQAADRFHIDRRLITAVMQVESNACERIDGKPTSSEAGAMGLMQVMPSTWNAYRERLRLGTDPYNPLDNLLAGSAYLHDLTQRLGMLDGLAAYFAGPSSVMAANSNGTLASPTTLRYVRDILAIVAGNAGQMDAHRHGFIEPTTRLFAIERAQSRRQNDVPKNASSTLFVITRGHTRDKAFAGESAGPVE